MTHCSMRFLQFSVLLVILAIQGSAHVSSVSKLPAEERFNNFIATVRDLCGSQEEGPVKKPMTCIEPVIGKGFSWGVKPDTFDRTQFIEALKNNNNKKTENFVQRVLKSTYERDLGEGWFSVRLGNAPSNADSLSDIYVALDETVPGGEAIIYLGSRI